MMISCRKQPPIWFRHSQSCCGFLDRRFLSRSRSTLIITVQQVSPGKTSSKWSKLHLQYHLIMQSFVTHQFQEVLWYLRHKTTSIQLDSEDTIWRDSERSLTEVKIKAFFTFPLTTGDPTKFIRRIGENKKLDEVLGRVRKRIIDIIGDGILKIVGEPTSPTTTKILALIKGINAKGEFTWERKTQLQSPPPTTELPQSVGDRLATIKLSETPWTSPLSTSFPRPSKSFRIMSHNLVECSSNLVLSEPRYILGNDQIL